MSGQISIIVNRCTECYGPMQIVMANVEIFKGQRRAMVKAHCYDCGADVIVHVTPEYVPECVDCGKMPDEPNELALWSVCTRCGDLLCPECAAITEPSLCTTCQRQIAIESELDGGWNG